MQNEYRARFKTVIRNILPAVVVMAAGLIGSYLVYDTYLSPRVGAQANAAQISGIEPAAGDETIDRTIADNNAATPADTSVSQPGTPAVTASGPAKDPSDATPPTKVYTDEGEDSGAVTTDGTGAPAGGKDTVPVTTTTAPGTPPVPDSGTPATPAQ